MKQTEFMPRWLLRSTIRFYWHWGLKWSTRPFGLKNLYCHCQ